MEDKQAYIYGRNSVIESLESDTSKIAKIFLNFSAQGAPINQIYKLAKEKGIAITKYDKYKFIALENKINCESGKSQGVIALMSIIDEVDISDIIKKSFEKEKNPILVLLDEISDPHNLGAIARSAECAGACGIIMQNRSAVPITPTAVKVSAGALEHIPVASVQNLTVAIDKLKDAGFWVFGTDSDAEKYYSENVWDCPVALVIGSEGKGMRPIIRKSCDFVVKIPLLGNVSSLNASVSAAIVLFEIRRQRHLDF